MNLDEAQKQKVAAWIEEGLKLSDIQRKLASEFGLNLTYIETRFLVDDLKLMPKDQPRPQPAGQLSAQPPAEGASLPESETAEAPFPEALPGAEGAPPPAGPGAVSVSVDRVARLGALVSGSVTFSDGNSGAWHLDQMGRLGIVPKQAGYRPSPTDVQTFQLQLQSELAKLGF
jgi:hypothetical protein